MQAATTFYGWLFINTMNILYRSLLVTILSGLAIALIYFGYHNYIDIIGAVSFATLIIYLYQLLMNNTNEKTLFTVTIFSATFLVICSKLFYHLADHVIQTYYAIICLIIVEYLLGSKITYLNTKARIITTIFWAFIILVIAGQYITLPPLLYNIDRALVAIALPIVTLFAQIITTTNQKKAP
ncbi:MAG: hypothetical protein H6909_01555 [Rickettsiaceae bacterium]|nr:hypothetical protein [Rickettsiaceae bacterium]